MLQVQCNACGAQGFTESGDCPDQAVQCGCCPDHGSHDDHVEHVRANGDASCRPVTITPGGEEKRGVPAADTPRAAAKKPAAGG